MPTYADSLKYLDSFINYERAGLNPLKDRFSLGGLREALKRMGNPERAYPAAHIAGTKGKGSISVFVSSILAECGYRAGLFISPHLEDVRERIGINGRPISKRDFTRVLAEVGGVLGGPGISPGQFSFFEVQTLMAITYFKTKKVDYAVFECGLGGRLDSTNVITAKVSGFSPVSYDHTHILGKTLGAIAREKAAIIKKNARCVSSPQRPEVLDVIAEKCRSEGGALTVVGKDIRCDIKRCGMAGTFFDVSTGTGHYKNCHSRMLGDFQAENAAAAIGIVEALIGGGTEKANKVDARAVKRGIAGAYLPGRLEILRKGPLMVIDGAQNAASAGRLKKSVEEIFKYGKLVLLLGLSADKDIKGVCQELSPLADEVIVTRAAVKRAVDPLIIREYLKGARKVTVTRDVKEAVGAALRNARKGDMILAAGSFFLAGEVRAIMKHGR